METLDRKKIGMNIKVRRMQKLISQTAMAEKLGISQTHMSNVEVGRAMLSLGAATAAEKYFRLYDRRTALSGR